METSRRDGSAAIVQRAIDAGFEFDHERCSLAELHAEKHRDAALYGKWYVRNRDHDKCPFFGGWRGPYYRKDLAAHAALEAVRKMNEPMFS